MEIESKREGSALTPAEFNQIPDELENVISKAGLTPTKSSLTQVSQSISQMVGDASFYATSGTANDIVLSAISPRLAPAKLTNGMMVRFQALYENTEATSVNVGNLGAKTITIDGESIGGGKLKVGKIYILTYVSSSDSFELFESGSGGSNGSLKIGQIGIAPLGIDETLNMERYLNGQIIIQDQFKGFTAFIKKRVALYPSVACSENEWQSIVANSDFSQCGKFVIDDNAGTIRLPKVINIQGLTDLSKLAEIVEAGLPDHSHTTTMNRTRKSGGDTATVWSYNENNAGQGSFVSGLASESNPIYGNSNTVQQEQIQYPYFIQVATGAETEDNIINKIELNNPYSFGDSKYSPQPLNNLSWLKSEGQWNSKAVYTAYYDWALININNGVEGFKFITDEYTDYDVVINLADETFRLPLLDGSESLPSEKYINLTLGASGDTYIAPANGWFVQNGASTETNQRNVFVKNEILQGVYSSSESQTLNACVETLKGESIIFHYNITPSIFRFIYAQGNGSLYYYVGETVQNANLINAGRIEEKLVDKVDRSEMREVPCIVETYVNGTSWYRVWSDGWIEQGGTSAVFTTNPIEIALLKNFANTNYSLQFTPYGTNIRGYCITVSVKNTNNFSAICGYGTNQGVSSTATGDCKVNWYACGY